jgi:ParB-like chromosome segregation protein Spo0J
MLNKAESMSFIEGYEKLKAEAGKEAPNAPSRLPLKAIKFATSVFQPRDTDHAFLATDSHMNALAEAIRNAPDNQLEAITVWWSGKVWYVIDGHHRLAAYSRATAKDKKLKIETIPVQVFRGSLEEAIREASALNCRDKLPMSKSDKLERAWKLVCLDNGWTKEAIRDAASVSIRTVANMRSKRKELLKDQSTSEVLNLSWQDAKSDGTTMTVDDDWKEKLAITWQKRLVKVFAQKFAEQPEIAARALQIYSERLPSMLIREWPDELREVVDEDPQLLNEPQF